MSAHLDRALLLYQRDRHADAAQELRKALAEAPTDVMAHALLGLCLAGLERFDEAQRETESAVHLGPDFPFTHYAMASVLQDRGKGKEAEAAVREAVRLDPESAEFRALLSSILIGRRDWKGALAEAEEGLRIEADHVACNNLRAMALVQLGRREEAGATIDAALQRDPEDAQSHANRGWTLLHEGNPEKALEHFKESLRLDPTSDWARQGIVEALKARNPVYGLLLKYFLWMGRLSRRAQWGILVGGLVGSQLLRGLADSHPDLAPWVLPIRIAYVVFALLTWIASPMFNLLLRLDRLGRLALDEEDRRAANWVGLTLCLGLAALGAWVFLRWDLFLFLAMWAGFLLIPVSGTFNCEAGWPRKSMAGYTILVALAGLGSILLLMARSRGGDPMWTAFLLGAVLSGWVANFLAMARPTR